MPSYKEDCKLYLYIFGMGSTSNIYMWQSQVENEHYSYQFYTIFQNL